MTTRSWWRPPRSPLAAYSIGRLRPAGVTNRVKRCSPLLDCRLSTIGPWAQAVVHIRAYTTVHRLGAGRSRSGGGPGAPGICERMPELIDLAGRCVIVTGASSGIGESTARMLHAVGARPVLAARRADRLAALSEELDGALAVPTDVTDPAQVRDRAAAALDRHQRIDGLVNNAGASLHGPLDQVDVAQFSRILELNVAGLLAMTRAVLPAMGKRGFGRIVNVSSGTTRRTAAGVGAYASTKTAVNMLSAVLRQELAGEGNAVALLPPSITATEFA